MTLTFSTLIIIAVAIVSIALLTALIIGGVRSYNKKITESYSVASDKDILLYINSQPDKIISPKLLSRHFNIKKSTVGHRLRALHHNGLIQVLYNRNMTQYFYSLSKPIEKSYDLKLSTEPFMTLEDLLTIFKHYDYKVSLLELCLVTGLPLKVIKKEMKYFEDEKIIKLMLKLESQNVYQRIYTLNEPYRSKPDAFLNLNNTNFELKEIYEKVIKTDLV